MVTPKPIRRVLIVSSNRQVYDSISDFLPPNEFDSAAYASSAGEARRILLDSDFDIVIVNTPLPDEFGLDFAIDLSEKSIGILVICKSDVYEQVAYRAEDHGILTLPRPISKQSLYMSVKLLWALSVKLSKMEREKQTLQEKMADIRIFNRAKWLLIENLGMSEKDAHYHIEKQAMDMRIPRRSVAELIIKTYDK